MNKILEQTISIVAPYRCIACNFEGSLLCQACEPLLSTVPSRCYRCHKITRQSAVCAGCRSSVGLTHVWIASQYEDLAKKLIYKVKFDRAKNGTDKIAEIISLALPDLPKNIIVTHIPTANNRIRVRGYDQAELIAKHLAGRMDLSYRRLLNRTGRSRQVGSTRRERFAHLEKALQILKNHDVLGGHILLVDDITTTGATIEAAANTLKRAGAKTVDVAVFAQP